MNDRDDVSTLGGYRDYRGQGGSCIHPHAGRSGQKASGSPLPPGTKVVCRFCGKFVGYKQAEANEQ